MRQTTGKTGKRPVPRQLDALLFDLDGTLVDTAEQHFEATQMALARFGRSIRRADYETHIHGGANDDIRRYLFPDDPDGAGRDYVALKEHLFRESATRLAPMPGLISLLDRATQKSLKTAVVTNAPRENAHLMLHGIGLADRFNTVVIGDELPSGKPDPGPYVEALQRLDCSADRAIGFEDSPSGLAALTGAEIYSVFISPEPGAAAPDGADLVIDDFAADALHSALSSLLKDHRP